MKKITALLLSLAMITSLSACGEKKEEPTSTAETTAVTTKATTKATTTKITTNTTPKSTVYKNNTDKKYKFKDIELSVSPEWEIADNGDKCRFFKNEDRNCIFLIDTYESEQADFENLYNQHKSTYDKVTSQNQKILSQNIEAVEYMCGDEYNTYAITAFHYNNLMYVFYVPYLYEGEHSIFVPTQGYVISSINFSEPVSATSEVSESTTEAKKNEDISLGMKNALSKAKDYLDTMPFSYERLVEQLEFEGYTNEEAVYGADNCGADWNEQAAEKAQDYLDTMSFSRQSLIDQLIFEGFTEEQAEYGVTAVGY